MNYPKESFCETGQIINQKLLSTVSYGNYKSDYNGCSWIAVYNYMHCLGYAIQPSVIRELLQTQLSFGGKFGINPWKVRDFLTRMMIPCKICKAVKDKLPKAGILFYVHGKGMHYIAFANGIAYNAAYGKYPDKDSLPDILDRYPIRLLIKREELL